MAEKKNTAIKPETKNRFSKVQLLASERFRSRRDILSALLSEKETYTVTEAEQIIEGYMKGQVI